MLKGSCRCGAVTYEMSNDVKHRSFCHCRDCRRSAGSPVVAWAAVSEDQLAVTGTPRVHVSSPGVERQFCGECGTGLFYRNPEVLPGLVDVQIATLDDPEQVKPQVHIQVAERLSWMANAHELPTFERFPTES